MNALKEARAILKDLGVPFDIEQGTRHHKVYMLGRFVSVVPRGQSRDAGRHWKNFEAQLRRCARELGP